MKTLFCCFFASLGLLSSTCFAQPGTLDSDFDADGKLNTVININGSGVSKLLMQADGKIIAVGNAHNGVDYDFAAARYNTDGSLDNSFATNGKFQLDVGNKYNYGYSAALQSDGKIVIAGNATDGLNDDFTILRLNTNGTLDNTFSVDGIAQTSFGSGVDNCYAVVIQPDGKILAAGYSDVAGTDYIAIARYNSDGTLDLSFSTDGKVLQSIASNGSIASDIALQSDGKIIIAGRADNGMGFRFAVARFNTNGDLDMTFGSSGYEVILIGSSYGIQNGLVILPNDKILMGGSYDNTSEMDLVLIRLNSNGSLDNSFGTGGIVTNDIDGRNNQIRDIALQPDGKIVVAGIQDLNTLSNFLVARYDSLGVLDSDFNSYGYVFTDFDASRDEAYAIAMQPNGRIVVAGDAWTGTNVNFALARYISGLNIGLAEFSSSTNNVLIYPNPVQDEAMLEFELNASETISIELRDMSGKSIRTFVSQEQRNAGWQRETLALDGISAGNYHIVISNLSGSQSIQISVY